MSLYGSEGYDVPGLDHWGLVRDGRVREEIIRFLGEVPRAAVKRVSGRGGPGF